MIKIIGVGKIKEKAMKMMIEEYIKRLRPYSKLEIIEVEDESLSEKNSEAQNVQALDKEAQKVLRHIKEKDFVILLDLHGEELTSEMFAKKMTSITTYQSSDITFVIGGSLGLGKDLLARSNYRWKLSDLTFTHQFVRVLLLEQIYRSYKINNNETYHK